MQVPPEYMARHTCEQVSVQRAGRYLFLSLAVNVVLCTITTIPKSGDGVPPDMLQAWSLWEGGCSQIPDTDRKICCGMVSFIVDCVNRTFDGMSALAAADDRALLIVFMAE